MAAPIETKNDSKDKSQPWSDSKKKKTSKTGSVLGYGMIGVDAYTRIKDGENPIAAVGAAALTNAMWSMLPGGIVGALAVQAVSSVPDIVNQLDGARKDLNSKKSNWGGNFEATEASQNMANMDMQSMDQSRSELTRAMAGYARKNNNNVY